MDTPKLKVIWDLEFAHQLNEFGRNPVTTAQGHKAMHNTTELEVSLRKALIITEMHIM